MNLIGLFILSSCQKADQIGLDIDPRDTVNGNHIEDFSVNTVTVKDDSVNTFNLSQYPLGSMKDPLLGTTDAGLAMAFNLPSSAFSFGTNPILDSAVLVIGYGKDFYGDSLSTSFRVNVHELTEKPGSNYYSDKRWSYSTLAGSVGNIKRFAWRDSIFVNTIVKGGPDTAVKVPPQLRVRLDHSYIDNKLVKASAANFTTNTAFLNYLNGLYLSVERENQDAAGGIAFLNPASTTVVSRLEVYYRNTNSSGAADTLMAAFNTATEASSIKHIYSAPVQVQLENPSTSYSTVYVQPMGGLKTKITFQDLKKLREHGNIAINKAELVVYVDPSTTTPFEPGTALGIYQTDIAGQRQPLPDQVSIFGGSIYDSAKKRYVFNLSSYVQGIVSGRKEQYPVYIIASNEPMFLTQQSTNISPIVTSAARTVLAGKDHPNYKIKLNIYYTILH